MQEDQDLPIGRLESRIDKLTDAVNKLVLIEERQIVQGQRIGALEERAAAAEEKCKMLAQKLDSWINKAAGAAFVISCVFFVLNSRIFEKILGGISHVG